MTCSVCSHPDRHAVDRALLDGATLAAVSKQFQLSTSALDRHKAHLRAKVQRDRNRLQLNLQQYGAFLLSRMLARVERVSQAAETEGNYKVVLQAAGLVLRLLNTINKQDCPFDDRLLHAILSSEKWVTQSGLLPDDPEIMTLVRQSLAASIAAPCPDPGDSEIASGPMAGLPDDAILSALSTLSNPKTENRKLQTANHLSGWEKSGQKTGKPNPLALKDKVNQKDGNLKTKFLPLNPKLDPHAVERSGNWLADLEAGRLSIDYLHAVGAGYLPREPIAPCP